MLGKIRKTLKKVAKADPVARKTSKVLRKTGGPAGKAISKAMTGSGSRRDMMSISDTGPYETIKPRVGTGGNTPKSKVPGIPKPRPGNTPQKPGIPKPRPGTTPRKPGFGVSASAPQPPMKAPITVGGTSFNKSASTTLKRIGKRSRMARR